MVADFRHLFCGFSHFEQKISSLEIGCFFLDWEYELKLLQGGSGGGSVSISNGSFRLYLINLKKVVIVEAFTCIAHMTDFRGM